MIGRGVGMDDGMTHRLRWMSLLYLRVRIDHPIDGAVADRMRRDVDASLVEHANGLPVERRIDERIPLVAGIHLSAILVPVVIHPGGARTTAAVHEEFDAAGDEVGPNGLRWPRQLLQPGKNGTRTIERG